MTPYLPPFEAFPKIAKMTQISVLGQKIHVFLAEIFLSGIGGQPPPPLNVKNPLGSI